MAVTYKILEARVEYEELDNTVNYYYYVEVNDTGVVTQQWYADSIDDIDITTRNNVTFLNGVTGGTPLLA